jgi:hypothetical protein
MSFCPYCGTSIESPAEPIAKCPACGKALPVSASPDEKKGIVSPMPPRAYRPPRFLKDAVILLAIFILLMLLWRLMTRPKFLGNNNYAIRTKIFGPLGMNLAQTIAGDIDGENSSPHSPIASSNAANVSLTNGGGTVLLSNQNPAPGKLPVSDDSLITNHPAKAIVESPADFSYTNEPSGGGTSSQEAASLAHRLDEVGAKTGDVQFSLSWDNRNDLDLHCIDPKGAEIWYSHTESTLTGGRLDHDANVDGSTSSPVENIFWPVGGAPAGIYQVFVVYYAQHGSPDPTRFTVRTVVKNQTNYFSHTIAYTGRREKYWICTIQFDPSNPDPAKRRLFLNPGQAWTNFK